MNKDLAAWIGETVEHIRSRECGIVIEFEGNKLLVRWRSNGGCKWTDPADLAKVDVNYTLYEYERNALRTAGHHVLTDPYYAAGGLAEEAGELLGIIKHEKYHGWPKNPETKLEELGDALWYLTAAAKCSGFTLAEVAKVNIAKLHKRYPNGFTLAASRDQDE